MLDMSMFSPATEFSSFGGINWPYGHGPSIRLRRETGSDGSPALDQSSVWYWVILLAPAVLGLLIAGLSRIVFLARFSTKPRLCMVAKPMYWTKLGMVALQIAFTVFGVVYLHEVNSTIEICVLVSAVANAWVFMLMVVDHCMHTMNNFVISFYYLTALLAEVVLILLDVPNPSDQFAFRLVNIGLIFVNTVLSGMKDHYSTETLVRMEGHGDPDDEYFGAKPEKLCPELEANLFSRMTFWWVNKLVALGYRQPVRQDDLWHLKGSLQSKRVHDRFQTKWQKDAAASKANLWRTLLLGFGMQFYVAGFWQFGATILQFAGPALLGALINFTDDPTAPLSLGILYSALLFISAAARSILTNLYVQGIMQTGIKLRSSIICAVYEKSFRLSNKARQEANKGQIINLMAVDAQRFLDLCNVFHNIWAIPLNVVLSLAFLWALLGYSTAVGLGVMLLTMPLNSMISVKLKKLQQRQMTAKDHRMKLMDEILNGIKVVKLYAWDQYFEDCVTEARSEEVDAMRRRVYMIVLSSFSFTMAPFMVAIATFATYTALGNSLTADKAFVGLSLFDMLQIPLGQVPTVLSAFVQADVANKRLTFFLKHEEADLAAVGHQPAPAVPEQPVVQIKGGTFSWVPDSDNVIRNLDLDVSPGELVAVVGPIGSGKTSLLNAILGNLIRINGSVIDRGTVAYVSQQAWIQNATVRENILFGRSEESKFYEAVVDACALRPDLKIFPHGDSTEIGDRGLNLSGGQKQRLAMARAVYQQRDIYLLDDPLSAVDVHVGRHLFRHVIGPQGVLKNTARILVTHQLWTLSEVDRVVVLEDGQITMQGSYADLMANSKKFRAQIEKYADAVVQEGESPQTQVDTLSLVEEEIRMSLHSIRTFQEQEETQSIQNEDYGISNAVIQSSETDSISSRSYSGTVHLKDFVETQDEEKKGRLTTIEKETTGNIGGHTLKAYLRALGRVGVVLMILFSAISQTLQVMTNVWLAKWSDAEQDAEDNGTSVDLSYYLAGYGALGVSRAVFVLANALAVSLVSLFAAINLHQDMLHSVLRAPILFFDTTPVGRIVNRFSRDVYTMDDKLAVNLRNFLLQIMKLLAVVVVVTSATPWFIVVVVPLSFGYVYLQRYYVRTSRQVQRLEGVTRSPIYAHFGESLTGFEIIRAFNKTDDFRLENERKVDHNAKAVFANGSANRWFGVRMEIMGNMIVFLAAIFAVAQRNHISSSAVGLSLSYALSVTSTLNFFMRQAAAIETNIVCVERIQEYSMLDSEAPRNLPGDRDLAGYDDDGSDDHANGVKEKHDERDSWPQTNICLIGGMPSDGYAWPAQGAIEFRNYSLRYRKDLDLVLRSINLSIHGGEKIGVCGRTGAGKSSLLLGLFRLIEPAAGTIFIDGQDITELGLHLLRSRLTIIPQDPFLWAGTIRENLDPTQTYSDAAIWAALESARLKDTIFKLPERLNTQMADGGDNFSVGEKQLLCMARAILCHTKILVLDEATASIDMETDNCIQQILREQFKDCTVITIAHRINTIMDSDRILLLEAGQVKEFDSPARLLKQPGSQFYAMAQEAHCLADEDESNDAQLQQQQQQ
eukprot:Clim_evm44s99 gene=Clim_evmTU44s99